MNKTEISEEFAQLHREFTPNSLAYLLLTSKCEVILCGALASRLHTRFTDSPTKEVCREWKKFDVAVLSGIEPESLIEAKAAYTFDLIDKKQRPYPTKPVLNDIAKLRQFEFSGDRYVLVFFTHVYQMPSSPCQEAIKYLGPMIVRGNDRREVDNGFEKFHMAIGELPIVASGEIEAGNAFDADVGLLYWLFDANES